MGKRELLLIVVFVVAGVVLYRATAPAPPAGGGFSLRGVIDSVRREVGPTREYLGDEREEILPIDSGLTEVRVVRVQHLEVRGTGAREARLEIKVYSTGLDEREARAFARRVTLQRQRSGDVLSIQFDYPPEARQRVQLTLELPSRLRLRLARVRRAEARDLAAIELDETTGEVVLERIAGTIRGTHAGGAVSIGKAGSIDLTARRTEITLTDVSGDVRVDASGGALTARRVGGTLNVDGNGLTVELDRVAGAIAADLTQGRFEAGAVSSPVRVDARGTEVQIELAKAVPATAFTTDETIELRLPRDGGFMLDADTRHGEIRLPDGGPGVIAVEDSRRARGAIAGGGPPLELRTTHGDIVIR